jgi:hypothetical protein
MSELKRKVKQYKVHTVYGTVRYGTGTGGRKKSSPCLSRQFTSEASHMYIGFGSLYVFCINDYCVSVYC